MGFYNVLQGDVPYFKSLADTYAMSDNFHQSIQGGTGANHIALGTGDADLVQRRQGQRRRSPRPSTSRTRTRRRARTTGTPRTATRAARTATAPTRPSRASPRSTSTCSQLHVKPNCEPGHYYLLNNYNPGYFGDGTVDTTDEFTIPPSSSRTIGDELLENDISWRYYGDGLERLRRRSRGLRAGQRVLQHLQPVPVRYVES